MATSKPRLAVLITREMFDHCFDGPEQDWLSEQFELSGPPEEITESSMAETIARARIAITGWGTLPLTESLLDRAGELRLIAHSAGSVKHLLCDAVWNRGIEITSAAPALGVGVAEYALGLILTESKRVCRMNQLAHTDETWRDEEAMGQVREIYRRTIGVISASQVGRHLMKLLRNFQVKVLLYDPHISAEAALELGAVKVELDELMTRSDIVTVHAPNIPATRHLLHAGNLKKLKDGALLINTARGAIIKEDDLIAELETGRIRACLDVTDPEPPAADSPLRRLPNVVLTPHIAGAVEHNRFRQGAHIVEEIKRSLAGESLAFPITKEIFATMA